MRTARWPPASAATARLMASVVLPVPRANLFDENGIDASCGALYDAGALEGIRQDSYLLQVEQAVRDGNLAGAQAAPAAMGRASIQ